jgi:subtilisin family serine protease
MRFHSSSPVTALRTQAVLWTTIAVLALLSAGCSSERRLPLAPIARQASVASDEPALAPWKRETVIVTVADGADGEAIAADYGATLVGNSWRVAGMAAPPGQTADGLLSQVQGDSRVLTAEKDSPVETAETRQKSWAFDDGWGSATACEYQDATYSCGLHLAHQFSQGENVAVAILDTGAELTHPWIQPRYAGGWDFVDGDPDPSEVNDGIDSDYDGLVDEGAGHGTHVAGIVGLAAPAARLLIARVLDSDGRGDMATVARGIRWAIANGARVINLSLGSPVKSDAVKLALDEAAAAGVVVVAAAGNSGVVDSVEFPANYRNSVAVAAIDNTDLLAPFSSYGETVDICAPGVSIRSSYTNGGYALWSGTSMAAPWVSGGAALLVALHPDWPPHKIVDRINTEARSIWKLNNGLRSGLGAGALDLGAAISVDFASTSLLDAGGQ